MPSGTQVLSLRGSTLCRQGNLREAIPEYGETVRVRSAFTVRLCGNPDTVIEGRGSAFTVRLCVFNPSRGASTRRT